MDPLATLQRASELMDGLYGDAADFAGFYEAMRAYWAWRVQRNGFEPTVRTAYCDIHGDAFYASLAGRFGTLAGSAMREANIRDIA